MIIVLRLYHILGFWRIRLVLPRPRALGQHAQVHAAAEIEMFEFLTERYTADWVADGAAGDPDASPIFVLGQPRSRVRIAR